MECIYVHNGYCVCAESPYMRCNVDSCEYSYPKKRTTNADRVRSTTDEELYKEGVLDVSR